MARPNGQEAWSGKIPTRLAILVMCACVDDHVCSLGYLLICFSPYYRHMLSILPIRI